jgi:hypothetical protein
LRKRFDERELAVAIKIAINRIKRACGRVAAADLDYLLRAMKTQHTMQYAGIAPGVKTVLIAVSQSIGWRFPERRAIHEWN